MNNAIRLLFANIFICKFFIVPMLRLSKKNICKTATRATLQNIAVSLLDIFRLKMVVYLPCGATAAT